MYINASRVTTCSYFNRAFVHFTQLATAASLACIISPHSLSSSCHQTVYPSTKDGRRTPHRRRNPPMGTPPTGPEEGSSSSATETPSATPATLAKALEVAEELLQAVKRANPSSTGKQHAVPSPPLSTSAAKLHGYQRSQTKAKGLVKQTRTYLYTGQHPKEGPPAWSMHIPSPSPESGKLCAYPAQLSSCPTQQVLPRMPTNQM